MGEKEGERSHVACEEENEENRSLIDKKAYEDQFVTFCQFSFVALSLFSLSLYLSLLDTKFLQELWHWIKKGKEGKRKEGTNKEEQDQAVTT